MKNTHIVSPYGGIEKENSMLKNWKHCTLICMAAILTFTVAFTACGDGGGDGGGSGTWGNPPTALVGTWMTLGVSPVLTINANGTGNLEGTGSVDSWKVKGSELKMTYSGADSIVKWSVSGSILTFSVPSDSMNMGPMANMLIAFSPLTKQGGTNTPGNGGSGLSALAGDWQSNGTTVFQVTSGGKFIMNGTTYDISVSGSTATLKFSGSTVGTFDYAISNSQMVIISGTGIGTTIAALSPLTKPSGNNNKPIDPEVSVISINITRQPTKTEYNIGDDLDRSGMVVTATYSDGTSRAVTDYTTTFDSWAEGQIPVIVRYQDNEATFTVTVVNATGGGTTAEKIEYYWVDQHGSLVTTSGGATAVVPGDILTITAQDTNYTARQWYLNGVNTGLNGNTYSFSSATTGDHTVSLVVEKNGKVYNTNITIAVKTPVTVTFDANGGYGTTSQTVPSGSNITLPGGSWFSNGNLSFGGWSTNSSGTGTCYSAGDSYTATNNVTLYAVWRNLTPPAPTNLIASRGTYGPAILTWNAVPGATSYRVYRSISINGTYELLSDSIGKTNTTYYASGYLTGGATHDYCYKVTAINSYGESAMSEYARAW